MKRNKREWAALAKTLAARAELGSRREVRTAIIDLLVPLLGASGAQFHTFGPNALQDPMTVTQGVGRKTLEGITSTWARQLAELEGDMLGNLRDLGVVRLDDVATAQRSPRKTRTWNEIFVPLGVGDTLAAFMELPGDAPALLVLFRQEPERFQPWEREQLAYLLPFLVVAERIAQRLRRDGSDELTPRQREIVSLVRDGRSNAEIAERLEISENTVRNLLARAFKRHGVKSRTALIKVLGDERPRRRRVQRSD